MSDALIKNGNKPNRGGRPKGSPNKVSKAAKDLIAEVAAGLGGSERMLAWAKEAPENEKAFWTQVYPKLIPVTLSGDAANPIHTITRIELVDGESSG